MTVEILVLPRTGVEYDEALQNAYAARTGDPASRLTLRDNLSGMNTSERVRTQALGGGLAVSAAQAGTRVDSHYPVRVHATSPGTNVMFEVVNHNATDLVAGMSDWCVGNLKSDNRWCCAAACGSCGGSGCASSGQAESCCSTVMQAPCLTESQHTCVNPSHSSMAPLHVAPLGFVPVVISGLATHHVPSGHGLWLRPRGATSFTRFAQGSNNEFWQTNFDRASGTYEIVYNVEFLQARTMVAFGSDPSSWFPDPSPPPPSPSPPPSPPLPPVTPPPLPPQPPPSPPWLPPPSPFPSAPPPPPSPLKPPGGPGAARVTVHKATVSMVVQGSVQEFTPAKRLSVAQVSGAHAALWACE